VRAISKEAVTEVTSSLTPTLRDTIRPIESTSRAEQKRLEESVSSLRFYSLSFLIAFQVKKREGNRCAITGAFDPIHARILRMQEKSIPSPLRQSLQAAHIIPLTLNEFRDGCQFVGPDVFLLFKSLDYLTRSTRPL